MASNQIEFGRTRSTGLVEVLDRILDKGLFVGGDIKISLAEVELLTIRIRLIVCSLDKAREIGLDWWMYDRHLSPGRNSTAEQERMEQRILALERQLGMAKAMSTAPPAKIPKGAPRARRRESR
jgi:gas vesicle protein GvpA/GvpJ/GvpM family